MAYYIVNDNGQAPSSAKVGDIVVTGGGIYEKTATGSVRRTDIETSTGYTTTGNYSSVVEQFNRITGKSSGGSGNSGSGNNGTTPGAAGTSGATNPTPGTPDAAGGTDLNATVDENGIVDLSGFKNFNPGNYSTGGSGISSDTSTTVKNVLGYIILGIIGLVLLDRALGK